ncbi:MAG: UvrD-helicase domain-containing protein [Chloroflexi bacterium]|nr:UvrD-helicase domain-containing protein [Chloroflexota bacterium]
MMGILDGLNPAQREAVEIPEGPLLILAGPGSGKTRVITHKVAHLIQVRGISPRNILAVTFTNKAAQEMKERLYHLLGSTMENLTMGTFHAFCAHLLRREADEVGLDRRFVIYDEEDQLNLLKRSIQEVGLDPKQYPPRVLQSVISRAKSELITPQEFPRRSRTYFDEVVARVYERYQRLLRECKGLDFDDLLMEAVYLFQNHPSIREKYQSRYIHLLIDEFQDTNVAQYVLAKQLAGKYRNICVVGDPDQSIYSWRSADLRNILNFEKDYPDARVVYLEENYRSTQIILKVADHVIATNQQRKDKKLWTRNPPGSPVTIAEAYNEAEEAQFVSEEIERLIAQNSYGARDCAVMYRTNAQSRALEEAFIRCGLPYKLVGGTRFYERREIKDVLAYLRLIHNPYDAVSLTRVINVPSRGIGQRTLDELIRWAKELEVPTYTALQLVTSPAIESVKTHPFAPRITQALGHFLNLINELIARSQEEELANLLDLILDATCYRKYLLEGGDEGEERWNNVLELRAKASEYRDLEARQALASFLEDVALISEVDNWDEKVDAVTLITLHAAKGLEFPVVFIVGMEDGIFPHIRSFDDPAQMEEERRLCYVGITRAEERLYLVRAFRRRRFGGNSLNPASRFLQDIPRSLTMVAGRKETFSESIASWTASVGRTPLPSTPTYVAGDRVRHARFGDGVVVSCQVVRDDQEVVVAFKGEVGVKKLLLSFAPLEIIRQG